MLSVLIWEEYQARRLGGGSLSEEPRLGDVQVVEKVCSKPCPKVGLSLPKEPMPKVDASYGNYFNLSANLLGVCFLFWCTFPAVSDRFCRVCL